MEVFATAALLVGAGGLIFIAVRLSLGNAALKRVVGIRHRSYAQKCADVRRARRWSA